MSLKSVKFVYFLLLISLGIILITSFILVEDFSHSQTEKILFFTLFSLEVVIVGSFLFYVMVIKSKQKITIRKSFQFYMERIMSNAGVGVLMFDSNNSIIWVSTFLERKGFHKFLGTNVSKILEEFKIIIDGSNKKMIKFKASFFEISFFYTSNCVLVKDITAETLLSRKYYSEKIAMAELEIDNYAQYRVELGEEGVFQIQQIVIAELDRASRDYQMIYRQYANGKFLIVSNLESVNQWKARNFAFLQNVHEKGNKLKIRVSLSIGVASGNSAIRELATQAQEALKQAQSRGGDQVVVLMQGRQTEYFGATSEASSIKSKVRIRNFSERLALHLASPEIENIFIQGHVNSDLDSIGAALGMRAFVRAHCDKPVYIANRKWDKTTTRAVKQLVKQNVIDEIFTSEDRTSKLVNENTLMIIVDTSNHYLIEQFSVFQKVKAENVYIFDHHRTGKIEIPYVQKNIYIDTAASSACEIITEVLSFSQSKINLEDFEVKMLLCGIYLDTNQFTKTTSWRTFAAASYLEERGADPLFAIEVLKTSEADQSLINKIMQNVREVKAGYYISTTEEAVSEDIISKAADEILRTSGRKASFVIAKVPNSGIKHQYKLSARSVGVNIQRIVESIGGGGHFSAAAAKSQEKLEVFEKNLIQAIVTSDKNEGNIN